MQTKDIPNTNCIELIADTLAEEKALEYLKNHLPIFAGVELNVVNAFVAGWEAAIKAETSAAAIRS